MTQPTYSESSSESSAESSSESSAESSSESSADIRSLLDPQRNPSSVSSCAYLLALGSSLGDTIGFLHRACQRLNAHPSIELTAKAAIYHTDPVGPAAGRFANSAVTVSTSLTPSQLLAAVKTIESDLGRRPRGRWQDREIDIDLLMKKGAPVYACAEPQLWLPHRLMWQRAFVLAPAKDIAADWLHPYFRMSVAEGWQRLRQTEGEAIAAMTTSPWPESRD